MRHLVRRIRSAAVAATCVASGSALAQPGEDVTLIPSGFNYWFMDRGVTCDRFEADSASNRPYAPQLGLAGDRFLSGQPFQDERNQQDELFAVRRDPFLEGACPAGPGQLINDLYA